MEKEKIPKEKRVNREKNRLNKILKDINENKKNFLKMYSNNI